MSNYTVKNLNKYRSEIKNLIINVFLNFPGLDKVYFKHPGFGGGVFGPSIKLFFNIDHLSMPLTMGMDKDPRYSPGECEIQAMLEIIPVNGNGVKNECYSLNANLQQHTENQLIPQYVELVSFQLDNNGIDQGVVDKYIDDIFIGIVRQHLSYSELSNIQGKLKGFTGIQNNRETEFKVQNADDKLLFQYYSNNQLKYDKLAKLDAIAVALVMIPENHQIVFKEI